MLRLKTSGMKELLAQEFGAATPHGQTLNPRLEVANCHAPPRLG